ncbi:M35 family metallo-endopeptidase [Methylocaldum sp. 14B]|uniref:M35 family metallo-endopeptidase n=1 Tax=Methylocaldum sp. 14B TaxID=1912213 RepID=UPI000989CB98|nr:M35 family metallo-endopeptidase [Methylocaldum sp. 14B]
MDVFTEVYDKSIELLKTSSLQKDWKDIESGLKKLLQSDGPSVDAAPVLDKLRKQLEEAAKGKALSGRAQSQEILSACQTGSSGYQDRAACIKQFRHFYLVAKKGNQSIWVVDSPKHYGKWTYDLFAGRNEAQLKSDLNHWREVFGEGNRKMMSEALQLARKWSSDVEVKLSGKSGDANDTIRRWFHTDGAKAGDLDASRGKLLDGFKKITAACNSGKVIFSDRPHKRADGSMKNTFASVNSLDVMPVIYIYELFLRTGKRTRLGNIPKLWLCALTVVHELSHKLVKTEDIRYDYDGLKPGNGFKTEDALNNADSWAYFAGDLVGAIPKSAIKEALS